MQKPKEKADICWGLHPVQEESKMVTLPEEHLAPSQTQRLGRSVFITASEWSCRTLKLAGSEFTE